METWKKIGEISVDAGLCWLGDPCYLLQGDRPKAVGGNWSEFCDLIEDPLPQQFNHDNGITGMGILTETGHGDGCYEVFALIEDGLTKAVKVVFVKEPVKAFITGPD